MSRKLPRSRTYRGKAEQKLRIEQDARRAASGRALRLLPKQDAASRQLQLEREGARPNNIAPSKYRRVNGPDLKVLHQGIDTIKLNVYGLLREDWAETLAMAKEDAIEASGDYALSPLPPFDGTNLRMRAAGRPYYEWVALSDDIDVQIRKPSKASNRPNAVIRVSSQALWRLGDGGKRALLLAADWLRPIFELHGYRVAPGRVDLATDYQGHIPERADLQHVVKRAAHTEHMADGEGETASVWSRSNRLTGFNAGRSTNVRASGYDKTREITVSGKTWFTSLWARSADYRPEVAVWRMEYQFGPDFLRDRDIRTVPDLIAALPKLWAYGMGWFSFRDGGGPDSNRSRWPVAAWWRGLMLWSTEDAGELPKVAVVRPRYDRLVSGFIGYLTSLMGVIGSDSPDRTLRAAISTSIIHGPEKMDMSLAAKHLRYAGFTMASA
jgi:hypothetical protein